MLHDPPTDGEVPPGGSCPACREPGWRHDRRLGARLLGLVLPLERMRCQTCGLSRWQPSPRLITLRRSLVWSALALVAGWGAGVLRPLGTETVETPGSHRSRPDPPQVADGPGPLASEASELALLIPLWAEAWSARSIEEYLSFYSPGFLPPDGVSRAEWEAGRRRLIAAAGDRALAIRDFEIESLDPAAASVRIEQDCFSGGLEARCVKRLELRREDDGWKIVAERSLPPDG